MDGLVYSEIISNFIITDYLFTAHLALIFVLVSLLKLRALLVLHLTLYFVLHILQVYLHFLSSCNFLLSFKLGSGNLDFLRQKFLCFLCCVLSLNSFQVNVRIIVRFASTFNFFIGSSIGRVLGFLFFFLLRVSFNRLIITAAHLLFNQALALFYLIITEMNMAPSFLFFIIANLSFLTFLLFIRLNFVL